MSEAAQRYNLRSHGRGHFGGANFEKRAVSEKGANGLMHLMPGAGTEMTVSNAEPVRVSPENLKKWDAFFRDEVFPSVK